MSKGRRYEGEQKLNIKKVVATIFVFIIIIMAIVLAVKLFKKKPAKTESKNISNSYISVYTNGKWGVINSKGEYVIKPEYESMIVIPDPTKAIFVCQENVDLENGTFESKVIDDKNKELYEGYDKIEAIQNVDSDGNLFYEKNTFKVSKNSKYGLINFNGKELLPCEYDEIYPIKNISNSFITIKDNKKGLVDSTGSIIIENLYSDIQALGKKYENGYIVKNDSSKYGIINYNKKQVLECKYTEIAHIYGNNTYVVKENGNWEVIDESGNVLLKDKFDEIVSIDNSYVIIKNNEKYGVISTSGEEKIKPEYQSLKYMFDGNYVAKKDGKCGVINLNNETKLEFEYENIVYMNEEGFIEAELENGQTALMNTLFETKCSGIVSEINTSHSFIKLRQDGTYKYYSYELGEKSVQDVYPANTLFLSKKDGKYGFVNKDGIVIVDYIYDDATEQNDYGYAAVKKDGKWGAIDSAGTIAAELKYELTNNTVISFLGKWHLAPDLNANYFTDTEE